MIYDLRFMNYELLGKRKHTQNKTVNQSAIK